MAGRRLPFFSDIAYFHKVGPYQLEMELWCPYKWPQKWVNEVVTPVNGLINGQLEL